jgi:hypothetical protein
MSPNVAFGALNAPNVALGALNAPNATLGNFRWEVRGQRGLGSPRGAVQKAPPT